MTADKGKEQYFPGIDYYNEHIRNPKNGDNHLEEPIDRRFEPRMPFHDMGLLIEGDSATDFALHFL